MKKLFFILSIFFSINTFAISNIAYLRNPSIDNVEEIGNYKLANSGTPFFSDVILFAANIHGSDPNNPNLYYNTYFNELLNSTEGINAIRALQAKGIKVQIAYLGDHQNAGWSCKMNLTTQHNLAQQMVHDVVSYGLDGINIDDEYSKCDGNRFSFYGLIKIIKDTSEFNGKILSMAVYNPSKIFFQYPGINAAYKLDQVYEMTYAGNVNDLTFYKNAGVSSANLFLGLWPSQNNQYVASSATSKVLNGNYGGMMIWNANNEFSSVDQALDYYSGIAQVEYGTNVVFISASGTIYKTSNY